MRPLVAILGPTATGKSSLALAVAATFVGEVINCDSTAVYRGFDIGTDKVPPAEQRGIPHHLIDIADPTDDYTAADFARDAAATVAGIHGRGRLPILVGGTGFYYRVLTRGLFPGPGKSEPLRERLAASARRRGVEHLWRMVRRVDPPSAIRVQPRDQKRLIRVLEVYFQTGRPLTEHFADTASRLDPDVRVIPIGLRLTPELLVQRVTRRVDAQFEAGLLDEVRGLLARGVPPMARPFGGLVYRQVMDYLRGVRDLASTHALIVRENKRYARRQLIWFRKEPNLTWFDGPGEASDVQAGVLAWLTRQLAGNPSDRL